MWFSLSIATIVLGIYAPTLWFDFTNWDDPVNVLENPYLNPVTTQGMVQLWTHKYQSLYVPLTYTSLAMDARIWGLDHPGGFHLTNVILMALCAVVVHRILRRMLSSDWAALAGALLFAAHPLQVEPVAWVTGRKDVLAGLFSLLAILGYVRWLQTRRYTVYILAWVSLLLALLCKPSAVAIPVIVLCIHWLWARESWARILTHAAPWFVLALIWTYVTMQAQPPLEFEPEPVPHWQRIFVAGDTLLFYLRKLFRPSGLVAIYERNSQAALSTPWAYAAILIPVVVGAVLTKASALWRTSGALIIAGVLPVLGLIPFRFQGYSNVADRYFFLSMLGVALAAGILCARHRAPSGNPAGPSARTFFAGAILLALTVANLFQQRVWKNGLSLWEHNLKYVPYSAGAHYNLGNLLRNDHLNEAVAHFRRAVEIHETYNIARFSLANSLLTQSRLERMDGRAEDARKTLDEARAHYDYLMDKNPPRWVYWYMAGQAHQESGSTSIAEKYYRRAIELNPPLPDAYVTLADVLARRGRYDEAAELCRTALLIQPEHPPAVQVLEAIRRAQEPLFPR